MSNKYNKRFFTCQDDLWEEFGKTVENDKCFKNKSEALRYLMAKYIKEQKKEIKK